MLRSLALLAVLTTGCATYTEAPDPKGESTSPVDAPGVPAKTTLANDQPAAENAIPAPRFGVAGQWSDTWNPPMAGPANVDAVVVGDWLVEKGFTEAHQAKVNVILDRKRTPYFFGYILTSMAKAGLGDNNDCDGDSTRKLCQEGADWVRSHIENDIVPAYRDAAAKISASVGEREALIHIEPDYLQFSERAQKNPLTRDESNGFMNKILLAIKENCASCRVVADFSPWFSSTKTAWATTASEFYAGWDRTTLKYVGLTGKQFAYTEGKVDNYTYAEIANELTLPLVIIDAYTFGGASIDVDRSWLDASKLPKMKEMGIAIVFLSQQGDVAGYDAFLGGLPKP